MKTKLLLIILVLSSFLGSVGHAQMPNEKSSSELGRIAKSSQPIKKNNGLSNVDPVIIAIENGTVYVDRPDDNVKIGDIFDVYGDFETFIHPISGEKIERFEEPLASLKITKIFEKYLEGEPIPNFAISNLKPGMRIQFEKRVNPVKSDVEKDYNSIDLTSIYEKDLNDLLKIEIANCKTNSKDISYTESIVRNGKTITITNVVTNKFVFNNIKKQHKKNQFRPTAKEMKTIDKFTLYYLGRKAGYKFIVRTYNKKKSEYIETLYDFNDYGDIYSADNMIESQGSLVNFEVVRALNDLF